jgi:hypothetical protein
MQRVSDKPIILGKSMVGLSAINLAGCALFVYAALHAGIMNGLQLGVVYGIAAIVVALGAFVQGYVFRQSYVQLTSDRLIVTNYSTLFVANTSETLFADIHDVNLGGGTLQRPSQGRHAACDDRGDRVRPIRQLAERPGHRCAQDQSGGGGRSAISTTTGNTATSQRASSRARHGGARSAAADPAGRVEMRAVRQDMDAVAAP